MLDLAKLIPQISALSDELARECADRGLADEAGLAALSDDGPEWQTIAEAVKRIRSNWLVGEPVEAIDARHALPRLPGSHVVVAVDGSQIPPARHEIADCYLINIGLVRLPYAARDPIILTSEPTLYFQEEDLFPTVGDFRQPINDRRIQIRRQREEFNALACMMENLGRESPALAMVDGTLILWPLEAEHDSLRAEAIRDYERMLSIARERRIPVVGYISQPGSQDVVNLLRAFRCGFEKAGCLLRCHLQPELRTDAPCAPIQRLADRHLFQRGLADGERSAVFGSNSRVLEQYQPMNRTRFFYLNAGSDVARIEVPGWVADDDQLLDLAHTIAYDQARKGCGYPRALTEAHELAVVRGADREALFHLVESALARKRVPISVTRKLLAKRTRSV